MGNPWHGRSYNVDGFACTISCIVPIENVEWSLIKGLDSSSSKVDPTEDAHPFTRAPKGDIAFWSIVYQNSAYHGIRDLQLDNKSAIDGKMGNSWSCDRDLRDFLLVSFAHRLLSLLCFLEAFIPIRLTSRNNFFLEYLVGGKPWVLCGFPWCAFGTSSWTSMLELWPVVFGGA